MYKAVNTGVVKINRLPVEFFNQLFAVQSAGDVQRLIAGNAILFDNLIKDESLPKTTRSFLRDLVDRSKAGKLNETMALKAVPLLYSMSTRAGGNSQIQWTVFSRERGLGLRFSERERTGGQYADYAMYPRYLRMGNELFELLNSSGRQVLSRMSRKLLGGGLIPWARVDYRTTKPLNGKYTFAIVDVGMGTVGTFEKDVMASQHGLESKISAQLVDSIIQYHSERTRTKPKKVVIALSDDYFDKDGALVRSTHDLAGLRERFMRDLGHRNVFIVPYSRIRMNNYSVSFYAEGKPVAVGKNDLMLVYNPNKPMEAALERGLQRHMTVVGTRKFVAISDKRVNSPLILAAKAESKEGMVVVPKRGPIITVSSQEELQQHLNSAGRKIGGSGVVVKLPQPIEVNRRSLPSALFFNAGSPFQVMATERALKRHFNAGARTFSTEELVKPHSYTGKEGGLELRLYYGGRTPQRARRR